MKSNLLNHLCCPQCSGTLTIKSITFDHRKKSEIYVGFLICISCNRKYPIINGIPRLLLNLSETFKQYPSFFSECKQWENCITRDHEHSNQDAVADMYSFGWSKFSQIWEEFREEFFHVIKPILNRSSFKNKLVLDVGCGQGRFTKFVAELSPKCVIGFDLSNAVDLAYENLLENKNTHIVQADIYHPPFKQEFDLVYSIGVIHHLPNPEKGFQKVLKLLKPNGEIFLWVYGWSPIIEILKCIRKITLQFPLKTVYYVAFFPTTILHILNLTYLLLYKFIGNKARQIIPLWQYADRSFQGKHWMFFDHFSVPIINFYNKDDLIGWAKRANLKSPIISARYGKCQGSSWRLYGIK